MRFPRKAATLVVAVTLVVASCGTAPTSTTEAAPTTSIEVTTTTDAETTTAAVGPTSSAATDAPVDVALPSGRDALATAEGTPHALWFWGAH